MSTNSNNNAHHETSPLQTMMAYNHEWAERPETKSWIAHTATSQAPRVLWLGCADSRISESLLCGTKPGEVFVHRNIANCFHPGDPNATSVLAYAVEHLMIDHIVVVGHYGCGGVKAAMAAAESRVAARYAGAPDSGYMKAAVTPNEYSGDGYLAKWLGPLRSLAVAQLRSAHTSGEAPTGHQITPEEAEEAHRALVRTHCCTQVANIESSSIVAEAARRGREITVDGWVYDVATGKLVNVGCLFTSDCPLFILADIDCSRLQLWV